MIYNSDTDKILSEQINAQVSVLDGLRSGSFTIPGMLGRNNGISVANVFPYSISPVIGNLLSGTIPPNSSIYVPLSTSAIGTVNNQVGYVELDYERSISVTTSQDGSFYLSGYDQYGEILTNSLLCLATQPSLSRSLKYIVSLKLTNSTSNVSNYSIDLNYTLSLPYQIESADASYIFSAVYDGRPLLFSDSSIEFLYNDFAYGSSAETTLDTGRSRPDLVFNPDTFTDLPFDGSRILTIYFQVYGYGTLPSDKPISEIPESINSLTTVIGYPQYSEGWVGWKS